MKRFLIALTLLFSIICPSIVQAAPPSEVLYATEGNGSQPQIVWKLNGLGRLSADMQFAPNGQILLPLANQLASIDTGGELQWSMKTAGGNVGYPVCSEDGSIYAPTSSSVQEIKPSGVAGWSCTVYPSAGGATDQWLGYGQGSLYFPLASGLYILGIDGSLASLSPWDTSELRATKVPSNYAFLAGAVSGSTCYVIDRTDNSQCQMVVFDSNGDDLSNYGVGELKQACIATGGDGTVFVAAEPKKFDRVDESTVYSFAPNSSQPQWRASIVENSNLLGLSLSTDDSLYLALAGKIYALDAKTGAIKWGALFTGLSSTVSVDNKTGYIYAGCSDGSLIAVDSTGKLSWELSLGSSISRAPLIGADGFLYAATDGGNLYKIELPGNE